MRRIHYNIWGFKTRK